MTRQLWLVRHARPLAAQALCYGRHDIAADEAETAAAAQVLAAALPREIRLVSSPLERCLQLARALQALRPDLSLATDARLAEMDFGTWENRPWNDIPREEIDAWAADFTRYRVGSSGETAQEVMARVGAALSDARQAGGSTAWITHAGVIKAATLAATGAGLPAQASGWPPTSLRWGAWKVLPLAAASPAPA
jgi:alpha-ribazole phosphatase